MSIISSSHLAPDEVARHTFGSVRRGFDPTEVRAYLESIAVGLRGLAEREHQLLDELAEAEHRAANPVLDEATLTAAVGSETARVLHSAHEAAAEMVAKSEAEADRLLTEAHEEIEQTRAQTESPAWPSWPASRGRRPAELRERAEQQAAAHSRRPRLEAEELLLQAREQCRAMVDEAQGLRARVLADLSKRRKVLHAQIEQLRAGRERLAETVKDVRRSVDTIADDLFAAEDNARLAAEAAGREALEPARRRTRPRSWPPSCWPRRRPPSRPRRCPPARGSGLDAVDGRGGRRRHRRRHRRRRRPRTVTEDQVAEVLEAVAAGARRRTRPASSAPAPTAVAGRGPLRQDPGGPGRAEPVEEPGAEPMRPRRPGQSRARSEPVVDRPGPERTPEGRSGPPVPPRPTAGRAPPPRNRGSPATPSRRAPRRSATPWPSGATS